MRDKMVALFGLGDQEEYGEYFVDAMGILYETITEMGAEVISLTETEGYDFEESRAVTSDGRFCGLVIDEDNRSNLTQERIATWVDAIKEQIT